MLQDPIRMNSSPQLAEDGHKNNDVVASTCIPLHAQITRRILDGTPFFSLEFFPPKTANGVANFFTREGGPAFVDITWHIEGDPANINKETSSTSIAATCLNYCRVDTMLHMTCAQYSKEQTLQHVEQSKNLGLHNILALRGDLAFGPNTQEYPFHASDMISWIREEYGDYFTVACAGHPRGHPEAPSYAVDLLNLKRKVEAGADFIITQLFFNAEVFEQFVHDCREIGIRVPIIPGILPIFSYESIRRIARLSSLTIPESTLRDLEPIKQDDDAVRRYGTVKAIEMCRRILSNGSAPSIHLYTMNREGACREILQELGLWQKKPMPSLSPEQSNGKLAAAVRPLAWNGRPKGYIYRKKDWDEFPNGRWGNSSSPAYNDLHDHYLFHLGVHHDKEELLSMFGESLSSFDDVKEVFLNFITQNHNKSGVKVTCLPWCELDLDMQAETALIREELEWANNNGILTINSQPSVNGISSSDPLLGWGKPGGYCYQKVCFIFANGLRQAYLECFIDKKNIEPMLAILADFDPRISYHIINHDSTNIEATTPLTVTWGVFPGMAIAQPTVVDPLSFNIWKDEAFGAWTKTWASLYSKNSRSREVIQEIHDEFCLVTLADNEFTKPTILFKMLNEMLIRSADLVSTAADFSA